MLFATVVVTLITACDKVDSLPLYKSATATTLSASASSIAVLPADSSKIAITLSWSYPEFAIDSTTAKYVIEIDSTGRNFSKAVTRTINGSLNTSYTGKEINAILLAYDFKIGVAYDMDIRITASYANNNNQLTSNTIKVKMTPYKVPPKIALPTSGKLFIVGDGTQGGWNNPVPAPSQEFARVDETTFAGVFKMNGGNQFLLLPVNGDWTNKYAVANNNVGGINAGGDFGYNLSDNFKAPTTTGFYKIVVDFQIGKFSITPYTSTLADNLFMVGDATPGGWNNPVPTPSQQFTRLNSVEYTLTLNNVVGGKQYLLLPVNGDWNNKYAVDDNSVTGLSAGGSFGYNLAQNFPAPAANGNYKIDINFATLKFKTTKL